MVLDSVWCAAGLPFQWLIYPGMDHVYICIGCLERRLGRRLRSIDFTVCPMNEPHPWNTPRLADRLGRVV